VLGGAFYIQPETRIALTYTPRAVRKYEGTTENTQIKSDGSLEFASKHDTAEILAESEQLSVAASHKIGSLNLLGGVTRYFPHTSEHEVAYNSSSASTTSSGISRASYANNGTNIFSFGAEFDSSISVVLTGNIHHYVSLDSEATGLAVGADLFQGSIVISPTISYDLMKFDYEGAAKNMKGSRMLLAVAVGTSF